MLEINKIHNMDCLEGLRLLDDNSMDCCVTSPPYWGLRDYGVEGQLGLEPTPEEYVERMVVIFREVNRALKPKGTLWLNLGDSYAGSNKGRWKLGKGQKEVYIPTEESPQCKIPNTPAGLKPKDLVGIPWMVAFALRADGWYLRSDIIWSKPNCMPENVGDRPTKAHEYMFLFSKSSRYYYDAEVIKEPCVQDEFANGFRGGSYCNNSTFNNSEGGKRKKSGNVRRKYGDEHGRPGSHVGNSIPWEGNMRNKRTVWNVATSAFPEAHFATFPPKLIEPCILAGCPLGGGGS
jgi:DNA modification methylase